MEVLHPTRSSPAQARPSRCFSSTWRRRIWDEGWITGIGSKHGQFMCVLFDLCHVLKLMVHRPRRGWWWNNREEAQGSVWSPPRLRTCLSSAGLLMLLRSMHCEVRLHICRLLYSAAWHYSARPRRHAELWAHALWYRMPDLLPDNHVHAWFWRREQDKACFDGWNWGRGWGSDSRTGCQGDVWRIRQGPCPHLGGLHYVTLPSRDEGCDPTVECVCGFLAWSFAFCEYWFFPWWSEADELWRLSFYSGGQVWIRKFASIGRSTVHTSRIRAFSTTRQNDIHILWRLVWYSRLGIPA